MVYTRLFIFIGDMAQIQTFPFSKLIDPVDLKSSRVTASEVPSNISSASTVPETRSKTRTFNGSLYQDVQTSPKNTYYGPDIVLDLPVTSSIALLGQPCELNVEVSGYPTESFIYQWYRNGSTFNGDSNRTISTNASGSLLTIVSASLFDNNDLYKLRITNPYNDPVGTGDYIESTTTRIYTNVELYHPQVLFTLVGAIEQEAGDVNP
jgi:hypothetical protein